MEREGPRGTPESPFQKAFPKGQFYRKKRLQIRKKIFQKNCPRVFICLLYAK